MLFFFLAVQAPDLLWAFLVLSGIEQVALAPGDTASTPLRFISYPYSHSLVADVVWALVLAGAYYAVRRYRPGALALGLGVLSHWVLDVVTHRPDLPLLLDTGPKLGLGLWNSREGTLLVELAMFAAGVAWYVGGTSARDQVGRVSTWALWADAHRAPRRAGTGPDSPAPA